MTEYTTVIYHKPDPSISEIKIAGNFNNWQPESLSFNHATNRFEYVIKQKSPTDTSGKYNFKFIINNEWQVDQNYSHEFDDAGNENNVILYTYGKDSAIKPDEIELSKIVQDEIAQEPITPDPTPVNGLSKQTSETLAFNPLTLTADETLAESSTVGSKQVPKTEFKQESKFIPLTETANGTPRADIDPDPQYFPPPTPVETGVPAGANEAENLSSDIQESRGSSAATNEEDDDKNRTTTSVTPSGVGNSDNSGAGGFGLGFFATLLHLITEFFRRWFSGGPN